MDVQNAVVAGPSDADTAERRAAVNDELRREKFCIVAITPRGVVKGSPASLVRQPVVDFAPQGL
ncbi:hypothetical protein [Kibdelosporangium philippinense]|uniref:hypothetical protein n=1 Tax=Kibdelosporangium philippinense TaxID=211113 RepID=UPI0036120720